MRRASLAGAIAGLTCALLGTAPRAQAQPQDAPARAEARARFERGLELFEERRYDAALAEFQRAYEIAPSAPALFNIARSHAFLGHAVEAVRFYERLLAQGGASMPAAMRASASADLERQRARIGRIDVRADVDGATVAVDGLDVATTPLAGPLELSAGDHVVLVRAPGYDQSSRAVQIAGGTHQEIVFTLRPVERGVLRIRSALPGVLVHVDERAVGTTPLGVTVPVPPGPHVVIGRRPGYRDARVPVEVEMRAEREVTLELEIDRSSVGELAALVLRIPRAGARARIDGEPHDPSRAIELPFGPHAVELEVEDRAPWRGTAELEAGSELVLRVELRWSDEARRVRIDGAQAQRTTGWALLGSGGAIAVASAIVLGWNESRTSAAEQELATLRSCFEEAGGNALERDRLCPPRYDQRANANDALLGEIDTLRLGFGIGLGVSAALGIGGLVTALSAPSEADVDRGASATLRVGPGSVFVDGTF